jgi:hypothetical protein
VLQIPEDGPSPWLQPFMIVGLHGDIDGQRLTGLDDNGLGELK